MKRYFAAVALALLAAATAAFLMSGKGILVLSNGDTGERYAEYEMAPGDSFSITFIHSVNKSPVTDWYETDKNGRIWLRSTVYYDFGAGVPFDLNEGESLDYAENGAMVISNINREISPFLIFVGTVSDHTLLVNEKEISLRDLCGRNAKVNITYVPPLIFRLF